MHEARHSAPPAILLPLLRLLGPDVPREPSWLAQRLDVGRDAVEAALAAARSHGAECTRDADGVRLARPLDLLTVEAVAAALSPEARRAFDLHLVDATGSTNADLRDAAAALPSGRALATELQYAGRGRRGRAWTAPIGGGLTVSVLWKFARGLAGLPGLSLAVGLAVARAVERCGAQGVLLKWPNDVLAPAAAGPAKLAGILIEIAGSTDGAAHAVIGIGVNVRLGDAAERIDQSVTDLAALGVAATRNEVLARVLEELQRTCVRFEADGFAPMAAEWNARHAFQGRRVSVLRDDGPGDAGTAAGVDDDGALLIDTLEHRIRVVSGEVSLRLA